MFKLVIILLLGLFLIPPCKAQDDESSTTEASSTGASTIETSTATATIEATTTIIEAITQPTATEATTQAATTEPPPTTQAATTEPPPTTQAATTQPPPTTQAATTQPPPTTQAATTQPPPTTQAATTQPPSTTQAATTQPPLPTTTTERPFEPIFRCDFTTSCFGNGELILSNGSEFNPSTPIATSEPPRAPVSGATSVTKPTINGLLCDLPYRPVDDDSTTTTNWDMWFCYNHQCPTANGEATCVPDQYGLTSLQPSETMKTVTDSLIPNVMARDASGDQCLRFYYYFTVYDGNDWGQQIELLIIPNDPDQLPFSIRTITTIDMQENKWQFENITFKSALSSYKLQFNFEVTAENRTEDTRMNRTVYFALDNIELYDYNCSYVNDELEVTTTTTPIPTTTTTTTPLPTITTTVPESPPSSDKPNNLPLILGLSLGIGIPVLLLIVGGFICYCKARPSSIAVEPVGDTDTSDSTDIAMRPINTKNENSTVSALVQNVV
ncbi:unnamed protein product [Adineta steineri]|uniref:MAM domain-containing protein n=1 Tax=Adineta steineri TaxID=433720 RepID=A0A815QTY8_9BILA|nr:unnamed protein product [Adineta steineri]